MKKVVLIVAMLMFLGFFQIQGYAIEYFNYNQNLTSDFLGYNYFDQSAFNSTIECNIFNPTTWWYCIFGSPNITEYTSCFDITFNSSTYSDGGAEARTGFINFEPNDNCAWNGTYDYHRLAVTPHELSSYCHVDDWNDYFNESVCPYQLIEEIPRNKEVIIFLRFLVNDSDGWDSNANYLVGFMWERNVTAGLGEYLESLDLEIYTETIEKPNDNDWTTEYIIIPPDLYSDRTLGLTLHLGFGTVTDAKRVLIDRFSVYTLDAENLYFASTFSGNEQYVQQECNTSESIISNINLADPSLRVDLKAINNAIDGFDCGVMLANNLTYTRRIIDHRDWAYGGGHGEGPAYEDQEYYIARDWVGFYQDTHNNMIFRQITPSQIIVTGLTGYDGNKSADKSGSLRFDNYGDIPFSEIYNSSFNETDKTLSYIASGDQFLINASTTNEDSDWYDVFSRSICIPRYSCEVNTLFWVNLDCSQTNITSCGAWGCNPEGNACNFPTDPLTNEPILTYGSYCLDNYTYYTVNSTGMFFDSCVFPDLCWQVNDTAIQCASEEEIEAGTITLQRRGQNIFVQYLGIGLEEALWLLAFIVSFGISAFLGYKIERWGGVVFMGSLTSWLLIFTLIGFLPAIIGGVFVFVSLLTAVYFTTKALG